MEKIKDQLLSDVLHYKDRIWSYIFGTFVFSGGKVISYRPRSIDISA